MIRVHNYQFRNGDLIGYIDGKHYLDEEFREMALLKERTLDLGNELHSLRRDNTITVEYKFDKDAIIHEAGYIINDVIYGRHGFYTYPDGKDSYLVKISRENGEFYDKDGKLLLKLEGEYNILDFIDYFGIACYYLELFI